MTRYARNPEVVVREETQDAVLLFNPDTNQIRVLNETAQFIWGLCDGSHDLTTIIDAIKTTYEDIPAEVDEHIGAFIEEMVATEFLGVVDA